MVLSKTGRQVCGLLGLRVDTGHCVLLLDTCPLQWQWPLAGGLCGLAEDYRRNVKYIRLLLFVDLCGE